MTAGLRLRTSLLVRMGIAATILSSLSVLLTVVLVLVGAFLGLLLAGIALDLVPLASLIPRLAPAVGVPSTYVAVGSLGMLLGLVAAYRLAGNQADQEYLLPPKQPLTWGLLVALLAVCYVALVETGAVVIELLVTVFGPLWGYAALIGCCILFSIYESIAVARGRLRELREQLLDGGQLAIEEYSDLVARTHRLAQQAGVPEPDVVVLGRERPESFTLGHGSDASIVLSSGLVEQLSEDELEAVVAHELSHLANGDSRLMGAALVPVLIADEWILERPRKVGHYLRNGIGTLLRWYGQLGVAVLSRGREWAADAEAARLTGNPAALASALGRLDEQRAVPREDLREWEQSASTLDILPTEDQSDVFGPFRTHPNTADRIDRLQRLAG